MFFKLGHLYNIGKIVRKLNYIPQDFNIQIKLDDLDRWFEFWFLRCESKVNTLLYFAKYLNLTHKITIMEVVIKQFV